MSFLQSLRDKLWPSNSVYLRRSDELLDHIKRIEGTLGTMKHEQEQLKASVRTLDSQLKRLTSMQEYCASLVRGQSSANILLAGWYGADNFGDELMLRTLVDYAPQDVRERLWVLIWQNDNYDLEYLNELGVRFVRYPRSTEEVSLLADSFDAVVWGGGAILDDNQYNSKPGNINTGNLFIKLNECLLARGKHVLAIGLSTNWELTSPAYISRLAGIIQNADLFSVRDELSLRVLAQAGADTSRVELCPDVAFGNRQMRQLEHQTPERYVLGFVPMYIKEMREANKLILESAISWISQQPDGDKARIKLIPFYRSGDAKCLKQLKDDCSRPDLVDVEPYTPEVDGLSLRRCTAVICSRYHAALVAGAVGTPFVCVYPDMHKHYQNKCRYLSEAFGCPDSFVPASTLTNERLRSMLSGISTPRTQPHQFFDEASRSIAELWRTVKQIVDEGE